MIRIYTYANNRPDFIEVQKRSFDKYIKGDYKFVVFNNAYDSIDVRCDVPVHTRFQEIERECENSGIETRRISIDELEVLTKYEGQEHLNIKDGKYTVGNVALSCPLNGTWPSIIKECDPDDIIILIDTDMFFTRDFDPARFLGDHDIAYVPQYRGHRIDSYDAHYAWNGIFMSKASTPNLQEMNWFCGTVNGHKVDVGGQTHHFLEKNPNLKKKVIEVYNIVSINSNTDFRYIDCHLNGNFRWTFSRHYQHGQVQVINVGSDVTQDSRCLPYMKPDPERFLRLFTIVEGMCDLAQENGFPVPAWFDFVGHENAKSVDDCFIFHYKSGSNYMGFSNDDYNRRKTRALIKMLGI
jgi:hypothetical protein